MTGPARRHEPLAPMRTRLGTAVRAAREAGCPILFTCDVPAFGMALLNAYPDPAAVAGVLDEWGTGTSEQCAAAAAPVIAAILEHDARVTGS